MLLVNGAKGIGTGFSTDILSYNPVDIVHYLRMRLQGVVMEDELIPYYKGFKGTITKVEENVGKYLIKGMYKVMNASEVLITELPIGTWTDDYKSYLETIIEGKKKAIIRDYEDNSTDKDVNILIKFTKGYLETNTNTDELEKLLKMNTIKTTNNMHLFNSKEQLKRYSTVKEILDEFYEERLVMYEKRRKYRLQNIENVLKTITNKVKYIEGILNNTIDLRGKRAADIELMLTTYGLEKDKEKDNFHYLTKMAMDSVSKENVDKMNNQKGLLEGEFKTLTEITNKEMWCEDLDELEKVL